MHESRAGHTATLLVDGRILVAGGSAYAAYSDTQGVRASAELYASDGFTWVGISEAELYDPASGTWTFTGALGTGRTGHTATLLPNGKVLIAGGALTSTNSLASAELYDPVTGTWTVTGSMVGAQAWRTATLLPNGHVLGVGFNAELYDPATGAWASATPLIISRFNSTATLLADGRVLVTGGEHNVSFGESYLSEAELYDPNPIRGAAPQPPGLTNTRISSNGSLLFDFTSIPGAMFSVLTTTNPALATANWTVLGSATEFWPGHFQFTDVLATNYPQRFFRLRSL
jgi:hypothetical protein